MRVIENNSIPNKLFKEHVYFLYLFNFSNIFQIQNKKNIYYEHQYEY